MAYGYLVRNCLVVDHNQHNHCNGPAYKQEFFERWSPILLGKLLAHHDICPTGQYGEPFWLNRHIIFCRVCKTRLGSLKDYIPRAVRPVSPRNIEEVGVIGLGNFGSFLARVLALEFDVTAWDRCDRKAEAEEAGLYWGTLEQVATKEVVVLAVPLQSMDKVLRDIYGLVRSNVLLVDVCSVKQEPIRLVRNYLPHTDLLATHPLFGPQSAKDGLRDHKLVVCDTGDMGPRTAKARLLLDLFVEEGLSIVEMSAQDHDREMARVQALTHFIARAINDLDIGESAVGTTAFSHLLEMKRLLGGDSWELFETIENWNLFAAEIRTRFMEELQKLERRLKE